MTPRDRVGCAALAFVCLGAIALVAQEIRLRVGTVVPRGSLWYDTLQYIAQETPPMGENLFLSSYRFERPLPEVYRSTLPYSVIVLAVVLLITYVPGLTLWLVRLLEALGRL